MERWLPLSMLFRRRLGVRLHTLLTRPWNGLEESEWGKNQLAGKNAGTGWLILAKTLKEINLVPFVRQSIVHFISKQAVCKNREIKKSQTCSNLEMIRYTLLIPMSLFPRIFI